MNNNKSKKWVAKYFEYLNELFNEHIEVAITTAEYFRLPLYANCISKSVCVWDEFFNNVPKYYKELYSIHVYASLYEAEKYGKEVIHNGRKYISLKENPDVVAKRLCDLCNITFIEFEKLNKEVHGIKKQLFSFPEVSFYKVGDVIREGLSTFEVKEVYLDDGIVMVKAKSLNSFDNGSKIIIRPESEIMDMYRIQVWVEG